MVANRIENFGGMVPAREEFLLPDTAAARSENAWLYSGALLGTNTPTLLRSVAASSARVYRIPNGYPDAVHISNSTWLDFTDADTEVIRAPIVGDTYSRYYWVAPTTQARYNTLARIKAGNTGGNAPFFLGIPSPANAPTVSPSGGSSGTTSTRAYVYTWVSRYGEEGPPSPATTTTGKQDDTWHITLTAADPGDLGTNRDLARVRIYRTVTGSNGVATFYLVVDQAIGTTTYNDTQTDAAVTANQQIQSTNWSAPPTDLQGWVTMPNGIIAGFRQNEVWFCEPYRPHAWPAIYTLAVEYPIVGLGVVGQTLVACTQGRPITFTGVNPSSMSQSTIAQLEPCISRASIVSTPEGVYYGSPNGLVLVNYGAATNITASFVTKDKWNQLAPVSTLRGARLGSAYYGFGGTQQGVFETTAFETTAFAQQDFAGSFQGILIDPTNDRVAFNVLYNAAPCVNAFNDAWSGELFVIRGDKLYWINIADTNPTYETFKWKSRKFEAPEKKNFAAMRVWFDVSGTAPTLNPIRNTNLVQTLQADQYGLVRVYADDVLITTRELRTTGELMRINSGLKYQYIQFEFECRVKIRKLEFASTAKELQTV